MKRKLISFITAGMLLMGSSVYAAEVNEKITFTWNEPVSSAGVTSVSITVADNINQSADVTFIAAYVEPVSGKILSIATETANVQNAGDTVTIDNLLDKSSEGATLKTYIWDSLEGAIPLRNALPAPPTQISVTETTLNSASLTWSGASDDYGKVEKYNIYDDGMLVKENVTTESAIISDLFWGTDYIFDIRALDDESAESDPGKTVKVKTKDIPNAITAGSSVVNDSEGQMEFVLLEVEERDAYHATEAATAEGVSCRQTLRTPGGRDTFLNYKFSEEYMSTISDETDFVMELTYYDDGSQFVDMEFYCENSNSAGATGTVWRNNFFKKTNTGNWTTIRKTFTIPGAFAYNDNAGNANYNIRFRHAGGGGNFKVYRFAVYPKSLYDASVNAYFAADGAKVTPGITLSGDAQTNLLIEKDGRDAVLLDEFNYTVTENALIGGAATIEINYFAENDTEVYVDNNVIALKGGSWQKVKVNVDSLQSGDHIIKTLDGSEIYIHSVRVASAS